jgi:diacylglycerol kinase
MVNLRRLLNSFRFAWRGLGALVRSEQSFRVHLVAAAVAIIFSIYFNIKIWQWCLIILLVGSVLILEILNTVFERLVDMLKPRLHEYVGDIKDMMSAIVLVASIVSVIIGLLIFIPYFFA